MKFAKYWFNLSVDVDGKFFGKDKVSIWGASNKDEAEAQSQAMTRAERFKDLLEQGQDDLRDYEYFNGYIKEEIIDNVLAEDGSTIAVLTRNNYGATVLNTENVFFGDIDVHKNTLFSRFLSLFGGRKKNKDDYLNEIEQFQKNNTQYTIKVYETFAGLRIVITNQLFSTDSNLPFSIFSSLNVDPMYAKLCKTQSCFRARLSPKPWRIVHDRPETRFPRAEGNEQNEFDDWLRSYQEKSKQRSVVKHMATFGSGDPHPHIKTLLAVHDEYACTGHPLLA